ncbi:hypothetical protein HELRODRAFT_184835 [Helobdella robusta]|uniref:Serine-threonine kinase receptor-associated protein n=1 Tax=Helobdella robusta TaxID=6412 RepID=T1FM24_HELRO|nr:hypothetical protein HELRODRAFT_184835 [Helobdella robusta]ESO12589.1 hypothetical protein HELRODRAFT_184835 [Helobdella robusta]
MTSMRQNPLTCSGHTRPVVHLSFSRITPDGYFVISASKDAKPMLRQGETGDWIGTFEGHKGAVWAATLNYEASKAATGSADFTAKVWNAVTGEEVQSFAHKHIVKCVDFSPDSNYLLTGSNEKLLRIYDLNKPSESPEVINGHTSNLKCCLWLDDRTIISAAEDKTIKLWDVHNKSEIQSLELKSAANDLEISVDGQILTVAYSNKVAFHNARSFEVLKEFEVGSPINSASLHPTRNVFVCGGDDFKMYKCDYESGSELESFKGHFGSVHCVRFSPDGELYASGSEDGTLRLWQTIVGKTYGLWKCMQSDDVSPSLTCDNAIKVDCC